MSSRHFIGWTIAVCLVMNFAAAKAQENANPCIDFNALNVKIRDRQINKAKGLEQLQRLLPGIKKYYYAHASKEYASDAWVFPLSGYNAKAIGGKNGNGYIASGYDYFDGNKHGGHPAHDIFIRDKDQDANDDVAHKPVSVLSMTGGIVIALETNWDSTSDQRGGNFIWIFEPIGNNLFYYAHNNKVFVKLGDIVKPGDVIATVGRTGLNAHKKRSPTHLHLMQLQLGKASYPRPVNCYDQLTKIGSNQKNG